MNDIATLARLIENLLRFGTIAAVQLQPPRVRVHSGDLLTAWLPWLAGRAGDNRHWHPPSVGEQVVLLSPSGQLANGVVLCGLFSQLIPANAAQANLHRYSYCDGAVIEYDSAQHRLLAQIPGSVQLSATGDISLHSDGNIRINAAGNIAITGQRVDIN